MSTNSVTTSRNDRKVDVLSAVLAELVQGNTQPAAERISTHYGFVPHENQTRSWTRRRALTVFRRDGFIDRYTGGKLVYPGALRAISLLLPNEFPAHPNWKMSETHVAYWELFPTLDHVVPIGRGGEDSEDNMVTTSMLQNQIKSNWTLEELGWAVRSPGSPAEWDGLVGVTIQLIESRKELLDDGYLRRWYAAV